MDDTPESDGCDRGGGLRVLGMRASGGPLFQAAMPLNDGLTVLCGQTGVGKSTLLDALYASLTGLRHRLDGSRLPDAVQPMLLVRADTMTVGALRRSVFSEVDHDGADEWLPADIRAMRAELDRGSMWAYRPGHRGTQSWTRSVAVVPTPGSAAREVFLWDQQLKAGCRQALVGAFSTARDLLRDWEFGFPLDAGHLDELVEHLGESAVFASTTGQSPDEAVDRCPLGLDDGLPVALNGTESVVPLGAPTPVTSVDVVTGELGDVVERAAAMIIGGADESAPAISLTDWAEALSDLASRLFGCLVLDAPRLTLRVAAPLTGYSLGNRPVWVTGDGVPLSSLSPTMRRWAGIAVHLAVLSAGRSVHRSDETSGPDGDVPRPRVAPVPVDLVRPTFILVDGPESSLDPAAVAQMAAGLQWIAGLSNARVIVTSQCPELIDAPDASVLRVHSVVIPVVRGGELVQRSVTRIATVPVRGRAEMGRLGLRLSDLQRRQRAILFVDSVDDEVLLTHLIGDTLRRLRVQVVPIGAAAARGSDLDGRFLLDATDALLLPLLSSVDCERVRTVWQEALAIAAGGQLELAERHLRASLPVVASGVNRFFSRFLCQAIDLGVPSRVLPLGLTHAGVIEYLPARRFDPRATTWAAVKRKHRAAQVAGTTTARTWHDYARTKYGMDLSLERLIAVADTLDEPPREIVALGATLEVLVTVLRG